MSGQPRPRRRGHRQPQGHRPAQEIPGPWGRGAGKDGRAILTLAPLRLAAGDRIRAGWLRLSAPRYPRRRRREELGPRAVLPSPLLKLALTVPQAAVPTTGTAPAPSGGLLQPPPSSWLRFSPLPSQPMIHAHSSSGPPRKAPKEARLPDTSVRAARLPAARRASQHLRRGPPATLFCLPAPAPSRSFHPPRKEAFAKRPCQPEAPRRAKRWQEGFDSRWS